MAKKQCSVDGCVRPVNAKSLCQAHYQRFRKTGNPLSSAIRARGTARPICSVDGCDALCVSRSYCGKHYYRFKQHGDPNIKKRRLYDGKPGVSRLGPCLVDGCERKRFSKGYCQFHFYRLNRHGDPLKQIRVRERAAGEGTFNNGYHFKTVKRNGRLRQIGAHRLVMEQKLGRELRPNENVHHINGDRSDNRPENLELWVKSQPCGQRPEDLLKWAREIIATYGEEAALLNS